MQVPQYALLNTVLPTRPVDDLEYRFTKGDLLDMDAATFRAFDAESPIGTRPGLSRMAGELPPISKKMRLGEEQRLRLRQLQGAGAGATAGLVTGDLRRRRPAHPVDPRAPRARVR